ncbi:GntR family transcriptional regulator [Bhargavaea ginsengi]|uniref:GntR family transcriptional regulator n=1 Tax=Bhargavaea ginsengi TaxID=426757 RepID=UPI00203AB6E0|nr:GntR family transcriptional regulator [Bhargavaea ginsengi]MCM3088623.1 GntR family transcriptional regulator [Bhargavaea ginsengi]
MRPIVMLPAREQVAEALRKAIFNQELQKGVEISQEQVAKELGISRMPVREAFQMLEREGLITTKSRKTIVNGLSIKDVADIIQIRALLEGEAAARACTSGADLNPLFEIHEEVKQAVANKDNREFSSANEKFHHALWEASGSMKLKNTLQQLWEGIPRNLPVLFPVKTDQSIAEHEDLVEALKRGDAEKARLAMQTHLNKRAEGMLAYFEEKKKG